MNMKRWSVFLLFVVACSLSAAAGFWFGFREAWWLGPAADSLPRGSLALIHIKVIAAGRPTKLILDSFEDDVDKGLLWGYDVFHHPLRDVLKPVWGIEVYPEYEKYAVKLANYRREHPSPIWLRLGTTPPSEISEPLNFMVERYATKP